MTARYFPEVFDVADLQAAKKIILTAEGPDAGTEARWAIETPYVMELIRESFELLPDMVVLDYGCGIGRMSKAMIDASGCFVIGVDISPKMRALAPDYVQSDRFVAVSPAQFDVLLEAGLRINAAISIWVLQHCLAPAGDIERIHRGLASGGPFFVLNMPKRAVPGMRNDEAPGQKFLWATDDIDVAALLRGAFEVSAEGGPDSSRTPNMADAGAFWMKLRKRDHVAALKDYRKAADLGEAYAMHNIAVFYQNGIGVAQDYAEAMRWYRKAADLGWANAMTGIGFLYEKGMGVAPDHAEAMRWWHKAAALGDETAKKNLAACGET